VGITQLRTTLHSSFGAFPSSIHSLRIVGPLIPVDAALIHADLLTMENAQLLNIKHHLLVHIARILF